MFLERLKQFGYFFTCERYTELASRQMEEPLNLKDKIGFHLHHLVCTFCRRSHRQFELIEKAARQLEKTNGAIEIADTKLSEAVREKIRRSLNSARN